MNFEIKENFNQRFSLEARIIFQKKQLRMSSIVVSLNSLF